jgi:hypothetical protein
VLQHGLHCQFYIAFAKLNLFLLKDVDESCPCHACFSLLSKGHESKCILLFGKSIWMVYGTVREHYLGKERQFATFQWLSGLAVRTFKRRCQQATGMAPSNTCTPCSW